MSSKFKTYTRYIRPYFSYENEEESRLRQLVERRESKMSTHNKTSKRASIQSILPNALNTTKESLNKSAENDSKVYDHGILKSVSKEDKEKEEGLLTEEPEMENIKLN